MNNDKVEGRVRESADGLRRRSVRSHAEVREYEQRLRERAQRELERQAREDRDDADDN